MAAVTQHERSHLSDLVRQHQAGIWRYLRFLGADPALAEDLVQETFLAFFRSEFAYRSPAETASYLRTVARNQLLLARRRTGREINTVQLNLAETVWAEVADEDGLNDYLIALKHCLPQLQDRAGRAIHLHYQERLGRAEIAERLGMKPDGIKTLLRRARKALRECVERKVKP